MIDKNLFISLLLPLKDRLFRVAAFIMIFIGVAQEFIDIVMLNSSSY